MHGTRSKRKVSDGTVAGLKENMRPAQPPKDLAPLCTKQAQKENHSEQKAAAPTEGPDSRVPTVLELELGGAMPKEPCDMWIELLDGDRQARFTIPAHQKVLCAASPVMHHALNGDMKEARDKTIRPDFDVGVVKRCVETAYKGPEALPVDAEQLVEMLPFFNFYGMRTFLAAALARLVATLDDQGALLPPELLTRILSVVGQIGPDHRTLPIDGLGPAKLRKAASFRVFLLLKWLLCEPASPDSSPAPPVPALDAFLRAPLKSAPPHATTKVAAAILHLSHTHPALLPGLQAEKNGLASVADSALDRAVTCMEDAFALFPLMPPAANFISVFKSKHRISEHLVACQTMLNGRANCLQALFNELPPAHVQSLMDIQQSPRRIAIGSVDVLEKTVGCWYEHQKAQGEDPQLLQAVRGHVGESELLLIDSSYGGDPLLTSWASSSICGAYFFLQDMHGWQEWWWFASRRYPHWQKLRLWDITDELKAGVAFVPRTSGSGNLAVQVYLAEADREQRPGETIDALWPADSEVRGEQEVAIYVEVGSPQTHKDRGLNHIVSAAYRTFGPGKSLQTVELPVEAGDLQLENFSKVPSDYPTITLAVEVAVGGRHRTFEGRMSVLNPPESPQWGQEGVLHYMRQKVSKS